MKGKKNQENSGTNFQDSHKYEKSKEEKFRVLRQKMSNYTEKVEQTALKSHFIGYCIFCRGTKMS